MKKELTYGDIVKEYFPDASIEEIDFILWTYTGFPCFWPEGYIIDTLRKQLSEAKEALDCGKVFDLEKGWIK